MWEQPNSLPNMFPDGGNIHPPIIYRDKNKCRSSQSSILYSRSSTKCTTQNEGNNCVGSTKWEGEKGANQPVHRSGRRTCAWSVMAFNDNRWIRTISCEWITIAQIIRSWPDGRNRRHPAPVDAHWTGGRRPWQATAGISLQQEHHKLSKHGLSDPKEQALMRGRTWLAAEQYGAARVVEDLDVLRQGRLAQVGERRGRERQPCFLAAKQRRGAHAWSVMAHRTLSLDFYWPRIDADP